LDALHYRFATPADSKLLAQLNRQLVEDGVDFGTKDLSELEKRMRAWLSTRRYRAVLFLNESAEVVAYALFREHSKEIYLRQFLVLPQARRHGVGRRAIALLQDRIWERGKRLTVEVLVGNRAGYDFWHSVSYQDCAVTLEIPAQPPACSPGAGVQKTQFARCGVTH